MAQDEIFAIQMRDARIAAGLTQAEVAKKLNISAQAVSNFERGKNNLSPQNLDKLCDLYDIDLCTTSKHSLCDDISSMEAIVRDSYGYDSNLHPLFLQFFGSILGAMDCILRQYKFCKESYELNKGILDFCLKYLSDPNAHKKFGSYELHPINSPPPSLMETAVAQAQKEIAIALDTLSKQLQTTLEDAARDIMSQQTELETMLGTTVQNTTDPSIPCSE